MVVIVEVMRTIYHGKQKRPPLDTPLPWIESETERLTNPTEHAVHCKAPNVFEYSLVSQFRQSDASSWCVASLPGSSLNRPRSHRMQDTKPFWIATRPATHTSPAWPTWEIGVKTMYGYRALCVILDSILGIRLFVNQ